MSTVTVCRSCGHTDPHDWWDRGPRRPDGVCTDVLCGCAAYDPLTVDLNDPETTSERWQKWAKNHLDQPSVVRSMDDVTDEMVEQFTICVTSNMRSYLASLLADGWGLVPPPTLPPKPRWEARKLGSRWSVFRDGLHVLSFWLDDWDEAEAECRAYVELKNAALDAGG